MKFDNLAYILYSHDSLEYMCKPFIGEQKQYFPIDCKKYFFYNKDITIDDDYETIVYDDSIPYANRLYNLLLQVKEDYVLIHHEDMLHYSNVDMDMFEYYYQIIQANEQFAYLKLIRGGESQTPPQLFAHGVYYTPADENYQFAVQPSIFNKKILLSILTACISQNIWELESTASKYIKDNKIQSLFAFSSEDMKKGLYHYDNIYYPIISTALNKGKFNYSEYFTEIHNFKQEYGIK